MIVLILASEALAIHLKKFKMFKRFEEEGMQRHAGASLVGDEPS